MPAPLPFSYFLKPENMLIKIHLANFRWRRNIKNFFCKELSKISEAHEQQKFVEKKAFNSSDFLHKEKPP